MYLFDYRFL